MDVFERPTPTKTRLPAHHVIRQRLGEQGRGIIIDYVDTDTKIIRFIIQPATARFEQFSTLHSLSDVTACVNTDLYKHNLHINPKGRPEYFRYIIGVLAVVVARNVHHAKTPADVAVVENLTDAILSRLPHDPILIMAVDNASCHNRLDVNHIESADPVTLN